MPAWLVGLAISFALTVAAYFLTPRPKVPKQETQDFDVPLADGDHSIPVVFGTIRVKGTNVIGYWEKTSKTF